jgi:hypothetical protein
MPRLIPLVLVTDGGALGSFIQAVGPWPLYILASLVVAILAYLAAKRRGRAR